MSEQFDIVRIFWGDTTPIFLVEIGFRTTVLFMFTLLMLRFVGHRGVGQLSISEFVLIVGLGSAVGDPMFYADVPLIYGMLVIALVVVYQVIVTSLTMRFPRFGNIVDGTATRLVVDGMLDLDGLRRSRLSRHEVFAELRHSGLHELGEIKRAYLELDGEFSILAYEQDKAQPGLSLLPRNIEKLPVLNKDRPVYQDGHWSCFNCGYTLTLDTGTVLAECPRCKSTEWTIATEPSTPV